MAAFSYRGVVRGNMVVLNDDAELPEGTGVLVTPLPPTKGSPQAILEALQASQPISHDAAQELRRGIAQGKRAASFRDPLSHQT